MAEKQTILGRISQLTRANINALIDRAEDPQKMLDQLVRDYSNSIVEARQAVAQSIGNLRMAEKDQAKYTAEANDWGNKALAASRKADELRNAGDAAAADKFDSLAKIALTKQITAEQQVSSAQPSIDSQRQVVEQLKTGLTQMEAKLGDLKSKRDELVARQRTAHPTSSLGRFEDRVRRVEAQAAGQAELAGTSLESQFAALESSSAQMEAEARLAALKSGNRPSGAPQITAGASDVDIDAAFAALKAESQPTGDTSSY